MQQKHTYREPLPLKSANFYHFCRLTLFLVSASYEAAFGTDRLRTELKGCKLSEF